MLENISSIVCFLHPHGDKQLIIFGFAKHTVSEKLMTRTVNLSSIAHCNYGRHAQRALILKLDTASVNVVSVSSAGGFHG